MFRAQNYETASTFVKVMQRKLVASFVPDTVYIVQYSTVFTVTGYQTRKSFV